MINDRELFYSREEIRRQLLQILEDVFKQKNLVLDKDNSSYLTFIVNLLSALSADVLYYENFLFGESNLITALLPSSVHNWATYIDYTPTTGVPAKTKLAFYFPFENLFTLEIIPFTHYFSFGDIKFTPVNQIIVTHASGNMEVKELIDPIAGVYNIVPSRIILRDDGKRIFTFQVDAINLYKVQYTYRLPALRPYEFVDIPIDLKENEHLVGASVKVGNERWERGILVLASGSDKVYDIYRGTTENQIIVRFGNGIFGMQPNSPDITIDLYLCNGKNGNIQSSVINTGDTLYSSSGNVVTYEVTNITRAEGGKDYERLYEIKRNAILNLRTRYRNVSQQDFEDDLPLSHPEIYEDARVVLFRSDNNTNDIYVYLTLKDRKGKIVPSSTITINNNSLQSNAILSFNTVLQSIAPFDSNVEYYSPFTIIKDLNRGIWKGFDTNFLNRTLELKRSYHRNPPYPTTISYEFNGRLTYNVNFVNSNVSFSATFNNVSVGDPNYRLKIRLILRESGGNIFVYSNVLNNGNNTFVHIFNSPDDLSRINLIEFQIILENVVTSNSMLIAAYSSSFSVMENYIVYGPLYRQGNNIFYVGVPVIEKNYYDNLTDDEKEKLYENILYTIKRKVYEEDRRLFNTLPHIRFVRTVGRVHNLNYTKENYSVKGIVKSAIEAQQFSGLEIGDLLLITDPIDTADPWHPHAGKIARYIENVGGQRVFNIFSVSQGTTARIFGEEELYVLVDTRWVRFRDSLPLKIEVEIFVENPDIIGLEEKYRKLIMDYLNEKRPDDSFKFSEIISLLHKVEGTKMVRFIAPKYDLIYDFDYKTTLQKLNKMQFISFVPEKIYTNEEHLKVIIRGFQNV